MRRGAMPQMGWTRWLALAVCLTLALPGLAQPPELPEGELETFDLPPEIDLTPFQDPTAEEVLQSPSGFGDNLLALKAWKALEMRKFTRARELTEVILQDDPESYAGHCLLGLVQHRAEANLPLALFHLKRCRDRVEGLYGSEPGEDSPWFWHALSLIELAHVSGEMDRHEDKVQYLLERDAIYEPRWPADRAWPLMRLRRYDEARQAVAEGLLLSEQPEQIATAKTALCAIEAEELLREESYVACMDAADYERRWRGGPTPFTNAAEAALGMLRLDEAENLMLEATGRFAFGAVANPWLDLTHLYIAQGRTSEALDSVRKMFEWRHRQPAYVDAQNRAEAEMTSAIFLLVAGRPFEATQITRRALERPDRTGFTSAETEQMEVAAALLDRQAHFMSAEMLNEEAATRPFFESLEIRLEAQRHRLAGWASGRRAASMMVAERILLTTIRPYLAGSIELPEWFEPELVAVLGPAVFERALREAREQETLPEADAYFRVFEVEIAWQLGQYETVLELVDPSLEALPVSEVLLQARVAARGAAAAYERGRTARALELYDLAWQLDPGVLRRLGLSLPTVFSAAADVVAHETLDALRGSPRFDRDAVGFRIEVTTFSRGHSNACLLGPQGSILACAEVNPRADESAEDRGRRLAREFQAKVFAPRLDLTQADLDSLDGSPTAGGGRGAERLRMVLSDVIDQSGGETR